MNYPTDIAAVGCRLPKESLIPITELGWSANTGSTPPEGTVIIGAYIPLRWYLRSGGITFIDCVLESYSGTSSTIHATKGDVRLEHCTVRGGPTACLDISSNSTVLNCLIEDSRGDGIKMGSNCLVQGNWIRRLGGPNAPKSHADGIQMRSGTGNKVLGNMFDMPINTRWKNDRGIVVGHNVEQNGDIYRNSACLMIQRDRKDKNGNPIPQGDNEFAYNYFRGGAYSIQMGATEGLVNKLHDNVFERESSLYGPYRLFSGVDAYNNRYEDGDYLDEKRGDTVVIQPHPVEPEPEPDPAPVEPVPAPVEPVPEPPEPGPSYPTWKVYNEDGTVTERWK